MRGAWWSAWRSLLQGSLLVRYGDPAVADAFCASRLAGDWGHSFGTLPPGLDVRFDRRAPPPCYKLGELQSDELIGAWRNSPVAAVPPE